MTPNRSDHALSRRAFVGAASAAGAGVICGAGFFGAPASAAGARDPRLVVIILRGALDGLSAALPVGDPDYADLHGDLAFTASGDRAALPLDGFFFAHPALAVFKRLLRQEAGGGRARGRHRLSRPLSFRRPGRARERLPRSGADGERLAQPGVERSAEVG